MPATTACLQLAAALGCGAELGRPRSDLSVKDVCPAACVFGSADDPATPAPHPAGWLAQSVAPAPAQPLPGPSKTITFSMAQASDWHFAGDAKRWTEEPSGDLIPASMATPEDGEFWTERGQCDGQWTDGGQTRNPVQSGESKFRLHDLVGSAQDWLRLRLGS